MFLNRDISLGISASPSHRFSIVLVHLYHPLTVVQPEQDGAAGGVGDRCGRQDGAGLDPVRVDVPHSPGVLPGFLLHLTLRGGRLGVLLWSVDILYTLT